MWPSESSLTFQALWYVHQQILLSRRRVTVGRLQALVLGIEVGHAVVCRYTHRSHTIPPIDWTQGSKRLRDLGQGASKAPVAFNGRKTGTAIFDQNVQIKKKTIPHLSVFKPRKSEHIC